MRIASLAAGSLFVLLLLIRNAAGTQTCILEAIEFHHDSQVALQEGMYDLTVNEAPRLEALSALNRDLQIALSDQSRGHLTFLAQTEPDRLVTDEGLSRFVNFEWMEADQTAWWKAGPEARTLESKVTKLTAEVQGHPDWPALRELYRSRLAKSSEMAALMRALKEAQAKATAQLAGCR